MSRKCSQCGFLGNPDDANCCGKCGKSINQTWIDKSYNKTGKDRWKVYDSQSYTVITKKRYDSLIEAERLSKLSIWEKTSKEIECYWKKYSDIDNWNTTFTAIFWVAIALIVIVFLAIIFSTTYNTKNLSRIEVNGKYGIGYSKDELLVKAVYDSISRLPTGNYWTLYDKSTKLMGVAYVNDSVTNIIEPKYKRIATGNGHYAFLRSSDYAPHTYNKYEYVSYDGKIHNRDPYLSLEYIGDIDSPSLFIANTGYQRINILYSDLQPINDMFKSIYVTVEDSILVASLADTSRPSLSRLYDLNGFRLNSSDLYEVYKYSDGVAWGFSTLSDYKNDKWSLLDREGSSLFKIYGNHSSTPIAYSEGIGWIKKQGQTKWTALDKKGNKLFDIDAYSVHPFSLGLAPVEKGSSYSNKKLGFVNKKGETIIPFKYVAKYGNPYFGRDSLVDVSLDGVEGKLHRNGKFIPN